MGSDNGRGKFKGAMSHVYGGVPIIGAKAPGELERLRKIFLEKLRDLKPALTWDIQVRGKVSQNRSRRMFHIFLLASRDFAAGLKFRMAYELTPQREDKFNPGATAKALTEAAEIAWADYEEFLNKYNQK